jgi:glycosyltransferase involved in cell wall biosynthesis
MISIGFDRQIFAIQKFGGIGRYFVDLYLGLGERSDMEPRLMFKHHQNAYLLQQGIGSRIGTLQAKFYEKVMNKGQLRVPISGGVDIQHSTYYLGRPKMGKSRARLVSTLYDMIPELLPQYVKGNPHANKLDWLMASDLIISISDTSASDLAFFQPEIANRIQRIHLHSSFSSESLQNKPEAIQALQDPFFLFVGQRVGYKNTSLLLRAFASSEPKRHAHKLLFAGGGAFSRQEQEEIARLQLSRHVMQVSVSDAELWYLYRNASAVLVPTLAEGFSLPLVEGLAADVPVICSDIPVHREVAQDYAQLINPLQHDDWADVLRAAGKVRKPSLALGMQNFIERLSYFSRERMINEHVQAYKSLVD